MSASDVPSLALTGGASLTLVASALGAYVLVVLVIGLLASRRQGRSPVEFFLAGRTLGTVVLFMALFGTNATPFVIVGIPAQAYRDGVGIFGLNAPIIALGIPLTFWAFGSPARAMGIRLGALTPAELHARRFGSRAVGVVLFLAFLVYTIPYMVSAVKGAATTLAVVTDDTLSPGLAGLGVIAVALLYTALGGMRATAWTNVLQGSLFLGFMIAAFFLVASSLGGLDAASRAVQEQAPGHLVLGDREIFAPRKWLTYGLVIALTVIAFPHMFARLMAARSDRDLKTVSRLYPVALGLLWIPAVMLGVWGTAAVPGLADADQVFSQLLEQHGGPLVATLGAVAVLAAVMSTLDAQILTLGSMLVRDVLDPLLPDGVGRHDVRYGRLFTLLVAAVVWVLAQVWNDSIFRIALVAFSGYVTLVPTLLLTVRWRRFTGRAALASIVVGNALYGAGLLGWIPDGGFDPVFWALVGGTLTALVVPFTGPPPDPARVAATFGDGRSRPAT